MEAQPSGMGTGVAVGVAVGAGVAVGVGVEVWVGVSVGGKGVGVGGTAAGAQDESITSIRWQSGRHQVDHGGRTAFIPPQGKQCDNMRNYTGKPEQSGENHPPISPIEIMDFVLFTSHAA